MMRITSFAVQSLLIVLAGSGGLATNLQAQNDLAITVSVPSTFTMGAHRLAAGTYRFSQASDPFLLSVLNVKTGHAEIFTVLPEQRGAFDPHGSVLFRESEGASVLNEVHFPGTDTFSEVVQRHGGGRTEAKASSTNKPTSVSER